MRAIVMINRATDTAEFTTLAEACLNFLIANPEELASFMNHAGLDPDGVRKALGTPVLDSGLIDYFAQNESALLAAGANGGFTPERFMRLWTRLNSDAQ